MTGKKPEPERVYEEKTRCCLKCGESFKSGWPGERVCRGCKSQASWREGATVESQGYVTHRG